MMSDSDEETNMHVKTEVEKGGVHTPALSRRSFLLGVGGGVLALSAGQLLAGCGGGGTGPGSLATVPYTMFISTFLAHGVLKYDSTTGRLSNFKSFPKFAAGDVAGDFEQTTAGLVVSPDKQNLFVFSPGSDQIFMLDANSGALKRTIKGSFVNTSHSGAINPADGKLYYVNAPSLTGRVGTSNVDTIEMLDPATGDHLGTFVNAPEVRGPFGLTWGPDGNLYVSSVLSFGFNPSTFPFRPDKVTSYDGKTGKFIKFVVTQQHLAFTMAFHPDGQLLLPSFFFNRVYNYSLDTGTLEDAFVNVQYPLQVLYGPDGDFYVSSFSDPVHVDLLIDPSSANDANAQGAGRVLRFDGKTGQQKQELLTKLPYGGFLAFA